MAACCQTNGPGVIDADEQRFGCSLPERRELPCHGETLFVAIVCSDELRRGGAVGSNRKCSSESPAGTDAGTGIVLGWSSGIFGIGALRQAFQYGVKTRKGVSDFVRSASGSNNKSPEKRLITKPVSASSFSVPWAQGS